MCKLLFNYFGCSNSLITFLRPVITSTWLAKHKVVWSEDLAEWTGTDGVHGTGLKIDKNCAWNILTAGGFIIINVDSLWIKRQYFNNNSDTVTLIMQFSRSFFGW